MPKTLLDALDSAARTSRGITFHGPTPTRSSYAELRDAAARMGTALAQRYQAGRPVLVILPNGPGAVTAFFGALHAGLVPAMLNPPRPFGDDAIYVDGLVAVSRQADDAPIIAGPAVRALLAASPAARDLVLLDPDALDAEPDDARPHPVALLQFTSGSLGHPKGVVLTHDAVLANAEGISERLGAGPDDIGCYWVPLAHDMGLIGSLVFLLSEGAEQVVMSTEQFAIDPAPPGYRMLTLRADGTLDTEVVRIDAAARMRAAAIA